MVSIISYLKSGSKSSTQQAVWKEKFIPQFFRQGIHQVSIWIIVYCQEFRKR